MYATVRTYSDSPDMADALVSREADVKDLIGGIDGFHAYYVIRTDGGAVTVSVFDDEAGASESTRVAADWIRANLPEIAGGTPQVSGGEVVISA
ncbi:MAG TPA: hypothetical protein VKO84_12235 [Gaiellaceae bacterium]|nr:hypothetical protein [Gaiellaceae bacterium]